MLSKLERMDPRIVYLLLAVGVSLPHDLLIGLPLDISLRLSRYLTVSNALLKAPGYAFV